VPIVKLTRKRVQGPGLVSRQVACGVSTRYNWWNGLPQTPITIKTTSTEGHKQVTWDNVHPQWSPKVLKERPPKAYKPKVVKLVETKPSQDDLAQYRGKRELKSRTYFRVFDAPRTMPEKAWTTSWRPHKPRIYESDSGGDFSSINCYDHSVLRGVESFYVPPVGMTDGMRYVGGFLPAQWPQTPFTTADLQNVGSSGKFTGEFGVGTDEGPKAWNKYAPKLYAADMGQTVGEIGQLLPMLRTTASVFSETWKGLMKGRPHRRFMPSDIANHWLNTNFGWVPFLSDLVKLHDSFERVEAIRYNCIRMNGSWIRRGGPVSSTGASPEVLIAESTAQHTQYVMPSPAININPLVVTPAGNGKGSYSRITYGVSSRTWFRGCFRYWVPEFDSPEGPMNAMRIWLRMYGIRISPLLVWNLTPWSWLADWYGNVGENIANYTTQLENNMAAKYAFIMRETVGVMKNATWIKFKPPYGDRFFEWTREYHAKTRRHASAFGFTIDSGSFSSYQWSILAALGFPRYGLSRRPLTVNRSRTLIKPPDFSNVGLVW